MNYRHAYHAGNFADVLKHVVLTLVIEHMKLKPAPFRVIDTHAGIGLYDLDGEAAAKTGEWRDGIGRLFSAELPAAIAPILSTYLDLVRLENPGAGAGTLLRYPGSPMIARRMMRAGDVLVLNELHPEDNRSLARLFSREPQTRILSIDGWTALKSLLPPKERRAVVLIDPPFEDPGELERMAQGLAAAHRRFSTGTYVLWYPIKSAAAVSAFHRSLAELGVGKLLAAHLQVRSPGDGRGLAGTGVVVLNPPFTLRDKLALLLPFLGVELSQGHGTAHSVNWIGGDLNSP